MHPPDRPPVRVSAFAIVLRLLCQDSGMSGARYARDVLGVSEGLWSMAQSGLRQPGQKLIPAAFRAYPWLTDLLGQALSEQLDTSDLGALHERIVALRPDREREPTAAA